MARVDHTLQLFDELLLHVFHQLEARDMSSGSVAAVCRRWGALMATREM
jgi:hypothetical protein